MRNRRKKSILTSNSGYKHTGPYAELMTNILSAFAQFERDIIVEKISAGRRIAKEKEVRFGRPGDRVNKGNQLKIDVCAKLYLSGDTLNSIRNLEPASQLFCGLRNVSGHPEFAFFVLLKMTKCKQFIL